MKEVACTCRSSLAFVHSHPSAELNALEVACEEHENDASGAAAA
jgi:hypothetical protein